ncbi:MAG: hypothetical protein IID33_13515 [Planctomycetes bacterium]|nr:hypothetical protein [Planctomycetota bacterium]
MSWLAEGGHELEMPEWLDEVPSDFIDSEGAFELDSVNRLEMGVLSGAGEKVFLDLEAALPDPPQNARIYVVNQCPLNAVGFDQALRLRYNRTDIRGCALSLAPSFKATTTDRIVQTGPRSVRLERKGALFFQSPVEVFHLFSQPIHLFPAGCRRWDLTLLDPPDSIENLASLHFEFPYDLTDERLQLFVWDNSAIQTSIDYLALAVSPVLRRFDPVRSAPSRPQEDASQTAGRDDDPPIP